MGILTLAAFALAGLSTSPARAADTVKLNWLDGKPPAAAQSVAWAFADGQLRTLQRQVKRWRGLEGPGQEVFFAQVPHPGRLCQSDFSHMSKLGVTIAGRTFAHLIYHFVLTYSNWEAFTLCYSKSFESLSEGLQNALWELGGVPQRHRTDCLRHTARVSLMGVTAREFDSAWPCGGGVGARGLPIVYHGNLLFYGVLSEIPMICFSRSRITSVFAP